MFLVYQNQIELALKVSLRYSRVEELEVAFLRGIRDWISRFKQKTETAVLNNTTERRGEQLFLSHIFTFANTPLFEGVVDQGIDNLRRDRIG